MTDYNSMKVPELKKLLQSRSLGVTGNKADLVARLVENDNENAPANAAPAAAAADNEDLINYSDDDEPAAPKVDAPQPAETVAAPAAPAVPAAAEAPQTAEPATTVEAPAAATEDTKDATTADAETKPEDAAPKENFSLHLGATDVSEEARKRAERAKRFGISEDASKTDGQKKAERAARFGGEAADISKSLDSALPERKSKRGRGDGDQGGRDNKRQSTGGAGGAGGSGRGGRNNRQGRNGRGQGGRPQGGDGGGNAKKPQPPPVSAADKAKMEARAKRFAAA